MKPAACVRTVEVTADGEGLGSHASAALLVELADRVGLTGAVSDALWSTRERRSAHDRGRLFRDFAVMLADVGDCVTDMDAYRWAGAAVRIAGVGDNDAPRAQVDR